jgi:hypothetical protein
METIIQSFEDSDEPLADSSSFGQVLRALEANIVLHIHSVWYWSDLDNDDLDQSWRVTPFMRRILSKHRDRFAASKP